MKRKKILALLLAVALLLGALPLSAAAEGDTLYWPIPQTDYQLSYTVDEANQVTITRMCDKDGNPVTGGASISVTIPAAIDGKPVVAIGSGAFNNSGITGVTIPSSVKTIGDHAFYAAGLTGTVTVPDSVTVLGESAFSYNTGVTGVVLGSEVTTLGPRAFECDTGLAGKTVRLPASVARLDWMTFGGISTSAESPLTLIAFNAELDLTSNSEIDVGHDTITVGDNTYTNPFATSKKVVVYAPSARADETPSHLKLVCENANVSGETYEFHEISEAAEITEYTVALTSVTPADATVTLTVGESTTTLTPLTGGNYSATVSNAADVTVTVSAQGYLSKSFTMGKGNRTAWALGTVALETVPVQRAIPVSITVPGGVAPAGFEELGLRLDDQNRATLTPDTDYTLAYPYVVLSEDWAQDHQGEKLTLYVFPYDSLKLADGVAKTTVGPDAAFALELTPWGKLALTLTGPFAGSNRVLIYRIYGANRTTELVSSAELAPGAAAYTSEGLFQGEYWVAAFNKNDLFSGFDSVAALESSGLRRGTDYVLEGTNVYDGQTQPLSLSVPLLDVTKLAGSSLVDRQRSGVVRETASAVTGQTVRVRIAYAFRDPAVTQGTLRVQLPDAPIYAATLSCGEQVTERIDDDSTMSVSVTENAGVAFLTLAMFQAGEYAVSAALGDGQTWALLGATTFTVEEARLSVPEVVTTPTFTATVQTGGSDASLAVNGARVEDIAAGTKQAVALTVPAGLTAGQTFTVSVTNPSGSVVYAAKEVCYLPGVLPQVLELSFDHGGRTYKPIENGVRKLALPYTYVGPTQSLALCGWAFTARIADPGSTLDRDSVAVVLRAPSGDTVDVPLTQIGEPDAQGVVTFQAAWEQDGQEGQPRERTVPVAIDLQYLTREGETSFPVSATELEPNATLTTAINEADAQLATDAAEVAATAKGDFDDLIDTQNTEIPDDSEKLDYANLNETDKAAVDALLAEMNTTDPLADGWLLKESNYRFSDEIFQALIPAPDETDGELISYCAQARGLMLQANEAADRVMDYYAASLLLKKPLREYENDTELLAELGVFVAEDLRTTAQLTEVGFVQVDPTTWVKQGAGGVSETVDTEKEVRVTQDNRVSAQRLHSLVQAVFGQNAQLTDDQPDLTRELLEQHKSDLEKYYDKDSGEPDDSLISYGWSKVSGDVISGGLTKWKSLNTQVHGLFTYINRFNMKNVMKVVKRAQTDAEKIAANTAKLKTIADCQRRLKFIRNSEAAWKWAGRFATALDIWSTISTIGDVLEKTNYREEIKKELAYLDTLAAANQASDRTQVQKILCDNAIDRYKIALQDLYYQLGEARSDEILCKIFAYVSMAHKGFGTFATWAWEVLGSGGGGNRVLRDFIQGARESELPVLKKAMIQRCGVKEEEEPEDDFIHLDTLIDPSGVVYEAFEANTLTGVTATVYYSADGTGDGTQWDAAAYDQINPQTTQGDVGYAWDVPQGYWKVKFTQEGYQPAETAWLAVPPVRVGLKTAMVTTAAPAIAQADATPGAIEIEYNQYMQADAAPQAPEGYTAEWVAPQSNDDGTALFAKVLRLTPFADVVIEVGQEVTVTLPAVTSYTGAQLVGETKTLTVGAKASSLVLNYERSVSTHLGETPAPRITVQVLDQDGAPMPGCTVTGTLADPTLATLTAVGDNTTADENGVVKFSVAGLKVGYTEITFAVADTTLSQTLPLGVTAAENRPAKPTAKVGGQTVTDGQTVTAAAGATVVLSSSDGAEIYYTTDGTCPCQSLTRVRYTGPVALEADSTYFRVAAYQPGMDYSQRLNFTVNVSNDTPGGGEEEGPAVTVAETTHGAVSVENPDALPGETVTLTATPAAGYVLESLTVTDAAGEPVAVTEQNGTFTFVLPEGGATVQAAFALPRFTDVQDPAKWYFEAVYYGVRRGYFSGVSATEFAPDKTMSRGMFATVLYHLAGAPAVTAANPFTDVKPGRYYEKPIAWAAEQGILAGYGDGRFGPDAPVTREQMALILWIYAGKPAGSADLSAFTDAGSISSWARSAVQWAVSRGILQGKGNGILDPKGEATRAQVAQIIMSYDRLAE